MVRSYFFFRFHAQPQKSYHSKFQKCCTTKIKKNESRKSFPLQQLKKGQTSTKNVFKEIETALYIFSSRFRAYFNHGW